jgi:hypothetical protein
MHAHKERPEWGSVYAQNEAMKDVIARCHEKTAVQVCTLAIIYCCLVSTCIHVYDSLVRLFSSRLSASAIPACRESDSQH